MGHISRLFVILALLPLLGAGQQNMGNGKHRTAAASSSTVATPTFSPVAGTYPSSQTVTISTSTSLAVLCYTTDGSTPTEVANLCSGGTTSTYSTPITVSTTQTVKALGTKASYTDSAVASATYTIQTTQLIIGGNQLANVPATTPLYYAFTEGAYGFNAGTAIGENVDSAFPDAGKFVSWTVSIYTPSGVPSGHSWAWCVWKTSAGACLYNSTPGDETITFNNSNCSSGGSCTQTVTMNNVTASALTDSSQLYEIQSTNTSGVLGDISGLSWAMGWVPTVPGDTVMFTVGAIGSYNAPGCQQCQASTQGDAQINFPVAGTIKTLVVSATNNGDPGTGNGGTYTIDVNESAQSQTCTINHSTGSPWACADSTHQTSVTAGQNVDIHGVAVGSGFASYAPVIGIVFVPTVPGQFLLPAGRITTSLASATNYLGLARATPMASESGVGSITGTAFTLEAIGAWVGTVPSPGNYTFNARSCTSITSGCSTPTSASCTITAASNSCVTGSLSDSFANNVFLDFQTVPASSPAAQGFSAVTLVGYIP